VKFAVKTAMKTTRKQLILATTLVLAVPAFAQQTDEELLKQLVRASGAGTRGPAPARTTPHPRTSRM
jgi:hypothetical protein